METKINLFHRKVKSSRKALTFNLQIAKKASNTSYKHEEHKHYNNVNEEHET
jgi:hypothetical protein